MKTEYRHIRFEKDGNNWNVLNRFTTEIIGTIKWSPIQSGEWCYWVNDVYWHKCKILSQTNLTDILKFINKL